MGDLDKKLAILNDGKVASMVLEHTKELLTKMKSRHLIELYGNFKMGKVDQATLLSSVAAMSALEDLETEITRRISRGNQASIDLQGEI